MSPLSSLPLSFHLPTLFTSHLSLFPSLFTSPLSSLPNSLHFSISSLTDSLDLPTFVMSPLSSLPLSLRFPAFFLDQILRATDVLLTSSSSQLVSWHPFVEKHRSSHSIGTAHSIFQTSPPRRAVMGTAQAPNQVEAAPVAQTGFPTLSARQHRGFLRSLTFTPWTKQFQCNVPLHCHRDEALLGCLLWSGDVVMSWCGDMVMCTIFTKISLYRRF